MKEKPTILGRMLLVVFVGGAIAGGVFWAIKKGQHGEAHTSSHLPALAEGKESAVLVSPDLATLRERAMFKPRATTLEPGTEKRSDAKARSLQDYYALRAYHGAPPFIPHEVDAEIERTMACNTCHEKGGYVPKFSAYAPVTPHPDYSNCMQCHVKRNQEELFRNVDWKAAAKPLIHRPALPGNPPPIPHTLQLRSDCLSCHAGPSAVPEIRVSHPERLNCRQCHVPQESHLAQQVFYRPLTVQASEAPEKVR